MACDMDITYIDEIASRIRDEIPMSSLPKEDSYGLFKIYAVLALGKGIAVTPEDVHNAWLAWMSESDPQNGALKPFPQLDSTVIIDDDLYVQAIRSVAETLPPRYSERSIDSTLFPNGLLQAKKDIDRTVDLYKLMVTSSENLVSRRQGVNTFFLTINGAILTATGLVISNQPSARVGAICLTVLALAGAVLAMAWRSLIHSFGQLNTGKFAVINRIEETLPVAVYLAEWTALGEGRNPKKYRSFTSGEMWPPWVFFAIYCISVLLAGAAAIGWLSL